MKISEDVSLFRAFAESLVSENISRLASMQVAERNIEDRLRALTSESRRLRQDSITAELLGIIASFEALGGVNKPANLRASPSSAPAVRQEGCCNLAFGELVIYLT